MYPEDCPQWYADSSWVKVDSGPVSRGELLRTLVPYPDQKPFRLVPADRGDDPRQHATARFVLEAFSIGQPLPAVGPLPVAALPLREGETYLVRRGKERPVIVLSTGGPVIPGSLARGRNRWQSRPALLAAPYYGADPGGARGGWPTAFIERIRHAEYPQYVWERLPIPGPEESILWLSHLFPIGADAAAYKRTGWRISDEGLDMLDQWFEWLLTGSLDSKSDLGEIRDALLRP